MKFRSLLIVSLCIALLSGCSSYKKVPYLQDSEIFSSLPDSLPMYDAKIMPKDLLTITVNCTDPEAAAPFNLIVKSSTSSSPAALNQQSALQQYLVSNEGAIDFPVLGTLQVSGLTKNEAENLIREKLRFYLKEDPIVTVRMTNYKITVLGEVKAPGMFTINNEKVNILEALALAGDLTIWGMRDNVKLIREDANGKHQIVSLNLNNSDIVASPYYYLQQNDILYVTPNEIQARNSYMGQSTSFWLNVTSMLFSVVNIIATLLLLA